ncbi:MAG: hypothetical protein G01um101456_507 [Parcubacteria group bacterium Gr01-1014_56]|nr:MAG: hypothetical protein G01um101456_507 [Parcubacteria group bacterium Gr01-1014_56]
MFYDRKDAGKRLAAALEHYCGEDAVVLALPRGGVVVGYEVAHILGLPLDIVVARKIGHPTNPEYAIGAVDESGVALLNEAEEKAVDQIWLMGEVERQRQEAARRSMLYRGGKKALPISGKIVVIVDDGIATGLTVRLAIAIARAQHPKQIIVAVPVAPLNMVQKIKWEADEVITLEPPEDFLGAVGSHYEQFAQVEDAEVIRLIGS